eukprot:TRINITY_DN3307_c0_g1_i16.p1 TRINITY_DN3307_c0_g1~~TRINITY_DN3307_c0_g1_i16.p1  ORF type:complete len:504 (+),score=88.31 TRINITY_DN3307_c0_g1_i16:875-2386(+)
MHYKLQHSLETLRLKVEETDSFWNYKTRSEIILELFICLMHVPPGLNFRFEWWNMNTLLYYSINDFCSIFMFLRFYLVLRVIAVHSKWLQEYSVYCCNIYGCEANTSFALKASLKDRPYTVLILTLIGAGVFYGLSIRTFERPYWQQPLTWNDYISYQDYGFVMNSIWLAYVTITTVGYGDFTPRTHIGRLFASCAAVSGMFLISLIVLTLSISSQFTDMERRSFDIIYRSNAKKQAEHTASLLITNLFKINYLKKKRHMMKPAAYIEKMNNLKSQGENLSATFYELRIVAFKRDVSIENQMREFKEKIEIDLEEIKSLFLIIEEMEEKMRSIEHYQRFTAKEIDRLYGNTLFFEKMLDMVNFEKAQIPLVDFDQEILKKDSSQHEIERTEFHPSSYQSGKVGIIEESQITRDVKILDFDELPPLFAQAGNLSASQMLDKADSSVKKRERAPKPLTPLKQRPPVTNKASPTAKRAMNHQTDTLNFVLTFLQAFAFLFLNLRFD